MDKMSTSVLRPTVSPGEHSPASSSLPSPFALADQLGVKSVAVVSAAREASIPDTLVVHSLVPIVAVLRMITLEHLLSGL
jgi:hypothetical protein